MLKRIGVFAALALSSSLAFANLPYYPVTFPKDEAAHVDNIPDEIKQFMEWWYLNGRLLSDEGKRFGYDVSMLNSSSHHSNQADNEPTLRIQVSMLDSKRNIGSESHFSPDVQQFSSDNLDIQVNNDYQLKKVYENGEPVYLLKAKSHEQNPRLLIDLKIRPTSEPMLSNKDGYRMRPDNTSNYNYTIPRMSTSGTIRINGEEYHISKKKNTNDTMMGHQWGDSNDQHYGWEVFNMKLQNGLVANIYLDVDSKTHQVVGGLANIMLPNGEKRYIPYNEFKVSRKNYWHDKKTNRSYPLTFNLSIPSIGLELENNALFPEQMVASFWHGFCNVKAAYKGKELKGYSFAELVYA